MTQDEVDELPQKPQASGPNPAEFRRTAFTGQTVNPDDKVSLEREAFRYA